MGTRSVIKYVLMVQPFHKRQQLSNNCKFATSSSYFIISNTVLIETFLISDPESESKLSICCCQNSIGIDDFTAVYSFEDELCFRNPIVCE